MNGKRRNHWIRIVCLLLVSALMLPAAAGAEAEQEPGQELLSGLDFEGGLNVQLYKESGGAAELSIVDGELQVDVQNDEVNTLMGLLEEENSAPHVAVVDDNGNEMLTGVLDTDGEGFILRSDHDHVDWTEYLNSGIRLQHRANIKHIQIQMNAIEDFIRRDSLKIYQDLINNRLETPDMSKAEGVIYKNPLFNTSAGNNTQSEAVKKALGNKNVLLIQGPPGTGKTTIIVEIIEQLVARHQIF